ncbi:MAG: hypothetical protein HC876_18260, partial [Chloroflexaceae bacterium]|nr:hypothetical protein [Chloroflexaceae bacterium]
KRLGLIGLGRIGGWMARYARAFGMSVCACDPYQTEWPGDVERATLEHVMSTSDFISVHVHLSDDTRQMIDRAMFAKVKRGAVFINTSRGAIADEQSLFGVANRGVGEAETAKVGRGNRPAAVARSERGAAGPAHYLRTAWRGDPCPPMYCCVAARPMVMRWRPCLQVRRGWPKRGSRRCLRWQGLLRPIHRLSRCMKRWVVWCLCCRRIAFSRPIPRRPKHCLIRPARCSICHPMRRCWMPIAAWVRLRCRWPARCSG